MVVVGVIPDDTLLDPVYANCTRLVYREYSENTYKLAERDEQGDYEFSTPSTGSIYFYIDIASNTVMVGQGTTDPGEISGSKVYYLFMGNKLDFRQGIVNFNKNGYACSGGLEALQEGEAEYAGYDEQDQIHV
jgi:hypothetical protein